MDKAPIEAVLKGYERVLNASDVDGVVKLYTEDGVFMAQHNLVGLIKSILEQHRIDPQLINLELTETVLLEDLAMAARVPRICRPMVWASRSMILAAAIHR